MDFYTLIRKSRPPINTDGQQCQGWRKNSKRQGYSAPPGRNFYSPATSSIMMGMDMKTKLNEAVKEAMKANDTVRKVTVRMVLAAIKQAEVDKQTTLDDAAVLGIIQKEIKNRREAVEEAKKAERADLVSANEAEIAVLETFLPAAMPADELRELVKAAIAETGASSPSDMGKVMKAVMAKVAGRAPGDVVSATVREQLK